MESIGKFQKLLVMYVIYSNVIQIAVVLVVQIYSQRA
jgi:hypothetical protein